MLFLLRFTDKPGTGLQRHALLEVHLAWLAQRRAQVLVAGSLREAPGAAAVGGAWIVEVESKAAAEALYRDDPFFAQGLRERVEILHWCKAFPGRVLV